MAGDEREMNPAIFDVSPRITHFRILEYNNIYSSHEHMPPFHELLYVLAGQLTLHLEKHLVFQAKPGDFLFVKAGTRHRDEFSALKGLRVMLVQFVWPDSDFFTVINNRLLLNLSYALRTEIRRRLEFLRANWVDTPDGVRYASVQLHGILLLFYWGLSHQPIEARPSSPPAEEVISRAKHFLEQNFDRRISLKNLAQYLGISPAYLSSLFHREYGISISKYLTSLRLDAARQLLQSSWMQVSEIASHCGFSSSSYFIKTFSDHYNITPRNYALKVRNLDDTRK